MNMFEISEKPKKVSHPDQLIIIKHKSNILCNEATWQVIFSISELQLNVDTLKERALYIGTADGKDLFAAEIAELNNSPLSYTHVHPLFDRLDDHTTKAVFRSLQLINWDITTAFCGTCGSQNNADHEENKKICGSCGRLQFPQYSPAVIVRVTWDDKILLGRSAHFPPGMYSTLAGFVEGGESLEHAAHREIREEVGIEIQNLKYHSSQPWPLPNSLMIGFTAEYKSGTLTVDKNELEDADWYDINNLPKLPIETSISFHLIQDFIQEQEAKNQEKQPASYKESNTVSFWRAQPPEGFVNRFQYYDAPKL